MLSHIEYECHCIGIVLNNWNLILVCHGLKNKCNATAGSGLRYEYVRTLSDLGHDVKFEKIQRWSNAKKRNEWNDVATNLKWLFNHKSILIMPMLTMKSLLMYPDLIKKANEWMKQFRRKEGR